MANYLLIESRDPFDSNDVSNYYQLARDLAREGNPVTLFLVQNGVLPVRRSAHSPGLSETVRAGVKVLADGFSLRERGIPADQIVEGVAVADLEVVVDELAAGTKTFWH
ncbi:DsrE family protein [Pelomicrobium sp.]|jgi:predicted peroxiredoxin|uniref:DsrE family protein n=1 Tax=Pelomicrobium sp. TaxID=2815319 RepID=UPI002FDD3121